MGETIVALEEVHAFARSPPHTEGARGGIAEADLEGVGAGRDVVGGIGMAFGRAGDADGHMRHVFGTVHAREDDSTGAIGLEAAIVEAKRLRYPARRIIGFRSEEHTSELQSLMRISYAVFCLKKKI